MKPESILQTKVDPPDFFTWPFTWLRWGTNTSDKNVTICEIHYPDFDPKARTVQNAKIRFKLARGNNRNVSQK